MNLTGTSNVLISKKAKLDPSYISRIRNGKRNPIRDVSVIRDMATHFARQCTNSYQIERMETVLGAGYAGDSMEGRTERIESWLFCSDELFDSRGMLSRVQLRSADGKFRARRVRMAGGGGQQIYHGIEGKLLATERLLDEVLRSPVPRCLLLLSDENMDWMQADQNSLHRLNDAIFKLIKAGHTIKAIHRVDRNLGEMLSAISQWMPYYSTGSVKSYYYPLMRDGLFQRTLFVAPGLAAVSSGSVNEAIEQSVTLFASEEKDVRAFEREFAQVLSLCKPLVHAPAQGDRKKYLELIDTFDLVNANTVTKMQSLCLLTMPDSVVESIAARVRSAANWMPALHRKRKDGFLKQLETHSFHEIIPVLPRQVIDAGQIPLSASNMLSGQLVYYTKDEYIEHLEHCISLVRQHKRFHFTLSADAAKMPYSLYIKEGYGAVMANQDMPPVTLAAFETKITSSLYEYLELMAGLRHFVSVDDELQIQKLRNYIDSMQFNSPSDTHRPRGHINKPNPTD